jgi:hypothetical protein
LSFEFDLRIELGLEKETQDGLVCPSCENFLVHSPVFGFFDCRRLLPSRSVCRNYGFFLKTICLERHYFMRLGRKVAICGKMSRSIQQIHRAIR